MSKSGRPAAVIMGSVSVRVSVGVSVDVSMVVVLSVVEAALGGDVEDAMGGDATVRSNGMGRVALCCDEAVAEEFAKRPALLV